MKIAAQVQELRLGLPKKMFTKGILTAIDKAPVTTVDVDRNGIRGDQQAEPFHVTPDRALLQYNVDHYAKLQATFPASSGLFVAGGFGENIVAAGMNEHNLCIGDILQVGQVRVQVSQPRIPCFKLNHRFELPMLARHVQDHAMTGWFYRVLDEGEIRVGDRIDLIERIYPQWPVAKIMDHLYHQPYDCEIARELSVLPALGDDVTRIFKRRLTLNAIEDWSSRLEGRDACFEPILK